MWDVGSPSPLNQVSWGRFVPLNPSSLALPAHFPPGLTIVVIASPKSVRRREGFLTNASGDHGWVGSGRVGSVDIGCLRISPARLPLVFAASWNSAEGAGLSVWKLHGHPYSCFLFILHAVVACLLVCFVFPASINRRSTDDSIGPMSQWADLPSLNAKLGPRPLPLPSSIERPFS